ncbi:MAG TPA: PAS domain-containing protein, partial [Steroidobacter sp.]|nr:PAS domain-containing protein [Steroidobacter sp.]
MQAKPGHVGLAGSHRNYGLESMGYPAFLAGGQAASLIATHDWSGSPLGPIERWPPVLKIAVALLLRSPLPMVLLWGEDGIFLYNDAYASLAGNSHPQLGSNVQGRDEALTYWPVVDDLGRPVGVLGSEHNTTERVLAERKLRESAERFHAFLMASTTSMYRMSPDWREMRQLDGQGFLSDTAAPRTDWLQSYIPVDEQPRVLARIDEAIRTKTPFDLEHRVTLADGNFGWIHSKAVPILDERGDIVEWFGAATDVTERKRMEDALRAGEERFRLLYEAQHTAHLVLAPDLTIETVSEQYLQATLSREEDLVGKYLFAAFPDNPDDPEASGERNLAASLSWVLEHRRPHRMPVQKYDIRRPSGEFEVRWWAPLNIPVLGPDGSVRHIIHQVEDVTAEILERQKAAEAKAAEERMRAVAEVLRDREEQFRTLADALPQLAWMADETGRIYWYNRRWYEYTGKTLEEMQGWGWRNVQHPDHVERVMERIQHSWDTGETWEDTFPLRGANGQYRWFLSRAVPLKDAEGRVTRWFGTNTDITERQEREDFQKLLLYEVSHRVKNSLAMVSALLDLQAKGLAGTMRHTIEDASVRVRTVATVHDQLWRQADARDIELAPFLSNLAAAIATGAPRHTTIVDVEPAIVSADAAVPIGLLVNELVSNAYKHAYAPDSAGEVRITGRRTQKRCYELVVADAGRGVPGDFDLRKKSRSSLGMRV